MSEFPALVETFEDRDTPDFAKLVKAAERVGAKFEQAEATLFPPLIAYGKETKAKPGAAKAERRMAADHQGVQCALGICGGDDLPGREINAVLSEARRRQADRLIRGFTSPHKPSVPAFG